MNKRLLSLLLFPATAAVIVLLASIQLFQVFGSKCSNRYSLLGSEDSPVIYDRNGACSAFEEVLISNVGLA